MQLRTHLFVWVVSATIVPLLILGLGAAHLGEQAHQKETSRSIIAQLNNLTAEVDRHMDAERAMVGGLARVPVVQDYLPVLAEAQRGQRHPEFEQRSQALATFLEAYQGTLPTGYTIRILDHGASTLIKVHEGERSPTRFTGLFGLPYAEREVNAPVFVLRMNQLDPGTVHHILLPQSRLHQGQEIEPTLMDMVVPLTLRERVVGYLAVSPGGRGVDRIFEFNSSLPQGHMVVAEIQPGDSSRNGLVLYDDRNEQRFGRWWVLPTTLEERGMANLRETVLHRHNGVVEPALHFMEYYPYPDQLVSWVVALDVEPQVFSEPFQRIRHAIWVFIGIALLLSFFIIPVSSRVIVRPVRQLTARLKGYADGEQTPRIPPGGAWELRELEASFNYMADTLDAARDERDRAQDKALQSARLASIGEMAAGIGHEINSPLNNILSLTKLMERELGEPERLRSDIAALRDEALRASDTVRGILSFARQVPPAFTGFDVRDWLTESVRLVGDRAREGEVGIAIHCPEGIPVHGDQHLLQQALSNLVMNAVQASSRGGSVVVEAETSGPRVVVRVVDQGAGIEPQRLDRVFDPFYTTKGVGEGSGLGLSVTLGIVEHHGGSLEIVNNSEGGVTATVILPRHEQDTNDG